MLPKLWRRLKNQHQIQEQEDVGPDPDEDDDISTTGSVAKSTTTADNLPSSSTVTLNTVEQILLDNKVTTCAKQTNILPFFNH